jgi:replicative DNA helicase Mcm
VVSKSRIYSNFNFFLKAYKIWLLIILLKNIEFFERVFDCVGWQHMEREEIIEKFSEFLNEFYMDELVTALTETKKSISIDFSLLDKFDVELADCIFEMPDELVEAAEEAVKQIDTGLAEAKLRVRFFNLPTSKEIRIRKIRAEHIGKLLVVDGIVKRASEIRPEVSESIFSCPECGARISLIQTDQMMHSPASCDCGCKRGFKLIDQRMYDARWLTIEEPFEITSGEQPSDITLFLKEDLTSPLMQNRTDPGNRIKVIGVLKQIPKRVRGTKSRQLEIYIDANYVEPIEVGWEELQIMPEDDEKIIELSKDPLIYEKLVASIAPAIYGLNEVKEAIVLQMFSGEQHTLKDKTRIRGNIHVLLVGDPSTAKSQIMKLSSTLIPRGKYASGTAVTGAGLTATVTRDEQFFGGWVLEAGALVLANKSICAIDEFSHVQPSDMIKLQEAMSLETISIAKASIVATLPAQTAILAGANPKFGRFDPYIPIKEQLEINDVLLSRFDLRFALRDVPNPGIDEKIADHILKMRHFEEDAAIPVIDPALLRKYIAYTRANVHPVLTKEAGEKLKEFYLQMRGRSGEDSPVSITLRQYDSLIRLSEASAKIRLSETVDVEDAQRAITLMSFSLRQFGFEPETGMIDIDRVEGQKMTSVQRSKTKIMIDVINALEAEVGKDIPKEEVIRRARKEGISNAEDMLNMMLREGMLFQPNPNVVRKTPS